MMENKPEDICVCRKTAQALFDAGIVVESYFRWGIISQGITYNPANNDVYVLEAHTKEFWEINDILGGKSIPAPTAAELDIPDHIEVDGVIYQSRISRSVNHWSLNYIDCYTNKALIDWDRLDPYPDEHSICEVFATIKIELVKHYPEEMKKGGWL